LKARRRSSTSEQGSNDEAPENAGGRLTYQFLRLNPQTLKIAVAGNSTFLVTAIVDQPPVLVDQLDEVPAALRRSGRSGQAGLPGRVPSAWSCGNRLDRQKASHIKTCSSLMRLSA
jgi:hypothetical protein